MLVQGGTLPCCAPADSDLNDVSFMQAGAAEQDAAPRWVVLHVRSRQEKALSRELSALHVSHYLPLVSQTKFYGKRKARIELPLFPGYVFLQGTVDELYQADRTKRVAQVIPVADQARLNRELQNIRMALARNVVLSPFPYLSAGMRVEVRSGPLAGLQGVIEENGKGDRLILQVEMLGRATSVEMDGAQLAPLD